MVAELTPAEWQEVFHFLANAARSFARRLLPGYPVDKDDLFQEAVKEVLVAAPRWLPAGGADLVGWCKRAGFLRMKAVIRETNQLVKIPRTAYKDEKKRLTVHVGASWQGGWDGDKLVAAEPTVDDLPPDSHPVVEFRRAVRRAFGDQLTARQMDVLVERLFYQTPYQKVDPASSLKQSAVRTAIRHLRSFVRLWRLNREEVRSRMEAEVRSDHLFTPDVIA